MPQYVLNQWGQRLLVGGVVAYVSKTGSHTTRKIGTVIALTKTKVSSYPDKYVDAVRVHWAWDGSYCDGDGKWSGLRKSDDKDSTIRVNNVVRLDPLSLADEVEDGLWGSDV